MIIYMQNQYTQRYYSLAIEQDLFETWCLKKTFGGLNSRRGRVIIQSYDSEEQALKELGVVEYKKHQRGYEYVDLKIEKTLEQRLEGIKVNIPDKNKIYFMNYTSMMMILYIGKKIS